MSAQGVEVYDIVEMFGFKIIEEVGTNSVIEMKEVRLLFKFCLV